MSDLTRVFDAAIRASHELHRQDKIARLRQDIATIGTRCGDCDKWMKSRVCPREQPSMTGYSNGPSSGERPCSQYVESASASSRRVSLSAELDAISRTQENG